MPHLTRSARHLTTRRRHGTLLGVASSVAFAWLVPFTLLDPPGPAYPGPVWSAWALGAALGLPLLLRRRWSTPVLVWSVVVAAAATAVGIGGAGALWVTYTPVAFALYTVASRTGSTFRAVVALGACLAAAGAATYAFYRLAEPVAEITARSEVPLWWQFELGMVAVPLSTAWVAGRVVQAQRAARALLVRRSAVEAVAAERLRISRELHDILGHTMTLIAVKATVAGRLADGDPEQAKTALNTIEQTSRDAMIEIRRLVGVLRPAGDDTGDHGVASDPARSPLPGSADLPGLVDRLRGPDLTVDLSLSGTVDLAPGVDLTVYRIVQEALTNVVEHSLADHCRIVVRGSAEGVWVEVADDGPPRTDPPSRPVGGHGLIGLRERVAMHGGSLTVDALRRGGFRVTAEIPLTVPEVVP